MTAPNSRARRECRQEGHPGRLVENEEDGDGGKGREREDRARRQRSMPPASMTTVRPITTMANSPSWRVDSSSEKGSKKPGMAVPKTRDGDDQRKEGNGIVGPALGQDLADDVIGNEIVAPGLEPFAKGHA